MLAHDEGVLGAGSPAAIRNVAHPLGFGAGPLNNGLFRVPGVALQIDGSSVVENPAVDGPTPGEVRVETDLCLFHGLGQVATSGHVALVRVGVAVQPVTGTGGTVVLEEREARDLLALLELLALDLNITGEVTVDQLGYLVRIEHAVGGNAVPGQSGDRFGIGAAFLLVQGLDLMHQFIHEVAVGLLAVGRVRTFVAPLHPATGVGDGTFLLDGDRAGQEEDFCLDVFRVHVRTFPEPTGFIGEDVDIDQPVELGQCFTSLVGVGAGTGRVHTPGEEALELALRHFVEQGQPGVFAGGTGIESRQILVGIRRIIVHPHGLEQ